MKNKFIGTGVALVTPFDKKGNVDHKALTKLVNYVIAGGVDYLVVLGTTGETATLSKEEKNAVISTVISTTNKRKKVVLGLGGNNTIELIEQLKEANKIKGIDGILSVTPYYNKPTQKGLIAHYSAIATSTELPIILYNVPGRTGVNMLPETVITLAEKFKNIVAVKEASGNVEQSMHILKNARKDFDVISGDDPLTLPLISIGAVGVISVVANALPKYTSDLVNSALQGDYKKAKDLHYQILTITNLLFAEGNPAGVKDVLKKLKVTDDYLRLPLVNTSKELSEKIKKELKNLAK